MKKIYKNEVRIECDAVSQNESLARLIVSGLLVDLHPTVEELCDVKTAISEAVTNAIVHGYREKTGKIRILCRIADDGEIYIAVTDFGKGIENIQKAMEPMYTTDRDNERSGMGFTIMQTFMDDLRVTSKPGKWTRVVMKKTIHG